ncbi:MAG: ionic transporter y4hA [Kineosporiaceae bacterium]|nr:ionic transporter y4hA [Kineosporiaceae bacterium]MBK8075446.1 ionic transporter y4hA [Kineosporiaceae bacterium]
MTARTGVTGSITRLVTRWTTLMPPLALIVLAATWGRSVPAVVAAVVAVVLAGAVLAAVHHAEVVAHRVGEPFGSLVLAVAVTVIEVGLILTLTAAGGPGAETLGRDTVFAAVMITCNGIVGLAILAGVRRHDLVSFNAEGAGGALATVITLAGLCFVLPNVTSATPGPEFSPGQLAFAAVASTVLYGVFVVTQTVRHRDFFLPVDDAGQAIEEVHADPPSPRTAWISVGMLMACLVAVVGLAKVESKTIESLVDAAGLPHAVVGVVIALLVLAPESLAAVRAARRNRMQTSFNLAYGSAIASIGLTVPALALATLWVDTPLLLGLTQVQLVLFSLTVVVNILTVVPGRASRLQGGVHLALLAAYLFLSMNP